MLLWLTIPICLSCFICSWFLNESVLCFFFSPRNCESSCDRKIKGRQMKRTKNARKKKAVVRAISKREKAVEKVLKHESKTMRTQSAKLLYDWGFWSSILFCTLGFRFISLFVIPVSVSFLLQYMTKFQVLSALVITLAHWRTLSLFIDYGENFLNLKNHKKSQTETDPFFSW